MNRLTKRDFVFNSHYVANKLQSWSISECLKKLQEYENLAEDGRLVVLPCKPEQSIFRYGDISKEVWEWQVAHFEIYPDACIIVDDSDNVFEADEFGETVFLTREEAEAALAEKVKEG